MMSTLEFSHFATPLSSWGDATRIAEGSQR